MSARRYRAMVLIACGVVVVAVWVSVFLIWLCGRGAIPRNRVVGIRAPDVLGSDSAWRVGHRAAVGPAAAGAILSAMVWVIVALAPSIQSASVAAAAVLAVAGVGWAAASAVHAARTAPVEPPSGPDEAGELDRPLAAAKITHSGGLIAAAVVS